MLSDHGGLGALDPEARTYPKGLGNWAGSNECNMQKGVNLGIRKLGVGMEKLRWAVPVGARVEAYV